LSSVIGLYSLTLYVALFLSADILADYQEGIEYKRAAAIIDMVQVGTERRFKIKWEDDYPVSSWLRRIKDRQTNQQCGMTTAGHG
jgi:hypothetical protein